MGRKLRGDPAGDCYARTSSPSPPAPTAGGPPPSCLRAYLVSHLGDLLPQWNRASRGSPPTVQAPVLDGLADVGSRQVLGPGQVRDGTTDLQNAVVGAGRQAESADRFP